MTAVLGCIADDFTGGTDLPKPWPQRDAHHPAGCADTAGLGSRTGRRAGRGPRSAPSPSMAVSQALAALEALRAAGCRQFFWKYCSTFDSTPKGQHRPGGGILKPSAATTRSSALLPRNKRRSIRATFSWATGCCETSMRNHR
ncbi:MAG: four-carbon acid sugar kinase family protein [Bilophila wadsworthia]